MLPTIDGLFGSFDEFPIDEETVDINTSAIESPFWIGTLSISGFLS